MIRTVYTPVPFPKNSIDVGTLRQQRPSFAAPIRTLSPTSRRDLVILRGPDFVDEQDRDAVFVDPPSRPEYPDRTSFATPLV